MGTAELKYGIQKFVNGLDNPDVLKNVYDILEKAYEEGLLREVMETRALEAEEDIKAGRVYTPEEFRKIMKDYIYKR
jgi:hypothetical protein